VATKEKASALVPVDERTALLKEMDALIKRTNKEDPDPKALQDLRAAMDKHPELWRDICDLGEQTTGAIIEMVRGTGLVRESIRHNAAQTRDEMGYRTANPLEKGLIESVVQAWLIHQNAQYLYARNMRGSLTMEQAEFWERKLTRTQHRYLQTCETLARVRRLLIPVVQVNVARQQVNVGSSQMNVAASATRDELSLPPDDGGLIDTPASDMD